MAKQLNVNLSLSANTDQAKRQLQELQKQLSQLSSISTNKDLPLTQELLKASSAAAQLQSHLRAATDVNTGKLDLGKFNQQMAASGMSLGKYQKALSNLGPVGDKAFAQLAQSISTADVKLLHANTVMGQFVTSLKNTARWQLSSSMLHGFMGTIQSAYGYAQDLNKSLNSIRIVTGQSVEQMDAFAQRANKAAKALSTTTTAYTDAALIFYQQGLGDKEVEERTNAVIKMSNVTGDSATEVSSYMTAIWNNFDDGSESLEHYADVITALGASTASSSAEIAAGLEKFASVAETIGLSYNYSTAALATIVANTRQSADTVGTGLRTIFSRLQGLSLGETLDDGTDLNKYSKALKTVGVDILDASGNMKNMDTILTDLAEKWDSLSKAQQTALAQTVGGVRQYTNLIALMNNWDDMEENLRTAENSDGSLQNQADIYAESWEAAQKRVKASAQAIYQALLDDKFFIKVTNGFAEFLNIIEKVIDGLGGVKGVLLLVGSVVTTVFNKEISNAINSMAMGLMGLTKKGKQKIEDLRTEANDRLIKNATNDGTVSGGATAATYQEQGRLQNVLIKNASHLTEAEKEQAQILIDVNRRLGEEARNRAEVLNAAEREVVAQKKLIELSTGASNKTKVNNAIAISEKEVSRAAHRQDTNISLSMQRESGKFGSADNVSRMQAQVKTLQEGMKALGTTSQEYLGQKAGKAFDDLAAKIDNVAAHYDENGEVIKGHEKQLEQSIAELTSSFHNWDAVMEQTQKSEEARSAAIQRIAQAMAGEGQVTDELKARAEALVTAMEKAAAAENKQAEASGRVAQQGGKAAEEIKKMANAPQSMTSAVTQAASAMMSLGMVITSVTSLFNTLNDEEASTGDKIMALITTVGMLVPAIMSIVPAFGTASVSATAFGTTATAAGTAASIALWQVTLIVAAITAIAAVVIALVSSINANSPEAKLKKAEENAKALGESLDEAKSHAEELKNAFDGYQTIVDKLKNCTKGTQEWKDALEEANAKTSELLAQYPELLSKANLFDENGILNIDVLQEALDDANETVTALNAATLMAQADVQQTKVDVAKKDFAQDNENKDLEALLSSYKTMGNSSLELSDAYAVLNINMDEVTESGQKLANSLLNLANQSIAAANAVDNASISVINSWAKDQNIELEVGQSALMSKAYNETYESVSNAVKAASDTNSKTNNKDYSKLSGDLFEGTSFEGMSVSEAFNQARGTNYNLARNGVRGTGNNRTYAYLENGEEKEYTIKEMQATIAASVALEKMGAIADKAAASLAALDNNVKNKNISAGIKDWITSGNFESMTENDFRDMTSGMEKDKNGDYNQKKVEDYFKEILETDDVASILGDDWFNKFNSAAKNFEDAIKHITDNMSDKAKEVYNSLATNKEFEKASIAERKSIANLIQNAFETSGRQGAAAITDEINNALKKGIDIKDILGLTDVVNNFDWSSGSMTDFSDALMAAGIDAKELGINVETIFKVMTQQSATALENIQKRYKSVYDIVSGLSTGDSISDDDYKTLTSEVGIENMKAYFSTMADGTHQLVGDAQAFYDMALAKSRGQMLNNISGANSLNTALTAGTITANDINSESKEDGNYSDLNTARITYLDSLDLERDELEKLEAIEFQYNNEKKITGENLTNLTELIKAHNISEEEYNNLLSTNNDVLKQNSEALLSSASSLSELDTFASQVAEKTGGTVYGYSEALVHLASQYDNCSQELQTYLNNANEATLQDLKTSIAAAEVAKNVGLEADEIEDLTKAFLKEAESGDETLENVKDNSVAAADAAVKYKRLNDAVLDISENYDDYTKVLKDVKESTDKVAKAEILSSTNGKKLKATLADLLDTSEDLIDADFLSAIDPKDFDAASKGDEAAIGRIRDAFIDAQAAAYDLTDEVQAFKEKIAGLADGATISINEYPFLQSLIRAEIAAGKTETEIQNSLSGIGIHCDDVEFLHAMDNVATAAQNAGDAIIGNLSFNAETSEASSTNTVETQALPSWHEVYSSDTVTYPVRYMQGPYSMPQDTELTYPVIKKSIQIDPPESTPITAVTPVTGVRLSNMHKAAGGKVSAGTRQQAAINRGGSKGGSGGSSAKPQTKNSEKHITKAKEEDRYHVIKNQIEDLSAQYDQIGKAKDKAFGPNRIKLLDQEIAKQKELTAANKKYLEEVEQYQELDKGKMIGYGAIFDKNGTITNYNELLEEQVRLYNEAVDKFNEAYTDDEGAQKAFEAAQERYDQFMEAISQYEETQDLYKEQMQQILDDIMTEQSLLLERTQLEVELKINVSEDALHYLEYMMDNIENKAYDCAEAFGYLNGMTQEYFKTAEALEGGLRSLFANQGLTDTDFQKLIEGDTATYEKLMDMLSSGGTANLSDGLQQSEIDAAYGFTSDDVDTMRDYVSQLIEANQNLQEIRQTVHEQILNVWDEWNEKLDAGIAKIEHLQSITESYQNIIDIVGQKNLGVSNAFMSKMHQQSIDQANDKLEAEKARYESLKKARDDAYAKFEEQKAKGILSPEEIKQWEDSLAQMDDDVQSASESFQSAWEDALTAANEAFEAAVDQIMQAYDDAAAGLMGSMSDLQDAFDRKSDLSSQYLTDYEKIYQLTKLNRDLENSIDSTSNTKAKAELLELQSKINAYEEAGIDISEYQMEQLRQEYELKKAQIELEESQEAKSQVQMTRDADGNYSYVYTANADDVAKAEQNYEDKLHQMQESNANYINDLQSNMIQMEQDYQDKVQEIMKDTSLTAEERMVKLNELNQYYDEKMKFYMSEAELWEENSQRLYEEDWMNYAAATGYKISSEEEWLDHWNETQLSILTGFGSLEEYQTNHNMNVANLLLSSSDAFATWQTNIETAMQNAGTSMADFEEDATDVLGTVAEESEKTKDSVVNMAEKTTDAIGEVVNAVVDWENQYSATVQKMLAWNNALITSFNKLIAGWSAVQSSANSSGAGSGSGNGSGNGSNGGSGFNSSSGNSNGSNGGIGIDNSDKVAGVAAAIWLDGDASGWGNNPTRASRLKEKGVEGAEAYINAHGANGDIYADWASKKGQLRKYYYGSFDTGGYTGEWGLDGKFAMLHEKELVLNKDDTTHFLQAIDIVRQISELIDLNALSSAGGLSSLLAATASSSSQKLEQQVTIHAEFPNVTDKDQITEAFTDLVNLASQYANRK